MSNWGISKLGFKAKSFLQIKNDLQTDFLRLIDPTLRFTPDTLTGVLVGIMANQVREVWEVLQGLYSSFNPNYATGRELDALCSLTGTIRKPPQASYVMALVRLAPKTTLAKGSVAGVKDNKNAKFLTDHDVSNNSDKEALIEVLMRAQDFGEIHAPANTLNQIMTPQTGWLGITNPKDAILGCLEESDDELRLRRLQELRCIGSSSPDAMYSHLMAINGVQAVYLQDAAHAFTAYVMGGSDEDICQTIFKHKPLGVTTLGEVKQVIKVNNNLYYGINFSRPKILDLSLLISIKVRANLDNVELNNLKSEIISYTQNNLKLGDEPYLSKLYPIFLEEPKVLDLLNIKISPVLESVKPTELAVFSVDKIVIEQVL